MRRSRFINSTQNGGASPSDCAACGPGYACAKGSVTRTACEPGGASSDGVACVGCVAGEYQPSSAQSSCLACPEGSYCLARSTEPIACAPGGPLRSGDHSVVLSMAAEGDGGALLPRP